MVTGALIFDQYNHVTTLVKHLVPEHYRKYHSIFLDRVVMLIMSPNNQTQCLLLYSVTYREARL